MRHKIIASAMLGGVLVLAARSAEAVHYKIDDEHTGVAFRVRHLFTQVN